MAMRFEISGQSGAVNFVSAYAPTEVSKDETKQAFWDRLDSLVQRIPAKECVYVLMDANARIGRRIEGESLQDEGILGTYGRDELYDNGKLLLSFATDNKLAIMNTFFSTLKGGVSHTYNGVTGSRTSDFKRIDYVLTRQAHRRRVRNVVVHPQPALSAKADSDHNMVIATVDLGGRIAHNRAIRAKPKQRQFSRQELQRGGTWSRGSYTTLASKRASQIPQHRRPRGGLPKLSSKQRRQCSRQRDGYHVCRSGVKARKREQQ